MEDNLLKQQSEKPPKGYNHNFIAQDPIMTSILEQARMFAQSDFPILILGESGVGKEVMANEVHLTSPRKNNPFIAINCGAIPKDMIESELFGHEKGAFTSAHDRKQGLLEIANHGTLLLDEIGDLPYNLQQKLLRVIETKSFFRVGGTKEIQVDVRFISATNRNLDKEITDGNFREDLYYRISTLTINIPPLRARTSDIPLLVDYIIQQNPNESIRKKRFNKEALKIAREYSWPGNVRELQNVVNRTMLLSNDRDVIFPEDISFDPIRSKKSSNGRKLKDIERDHILNILIDVKGKKGEAARILDIDPKTLYRKMLGFKNELLQAGIAC